MDFLLDGNDSMHPVLHRLIHRFSQTHHRQAAQAKVAIHRLLQSLMQSTWPEVAWLFSPLTPNGFPMEFAFSSAEEAIRYTTEIAGPEISECKKLQMAIKLVEALEEQAFDEHLRHYLMSVQDSAQLDYGAWVSGRHCESGDRYKLYVEVPEQLTPAIQTFVRSKLDAEWILPERTTPLRMIGVEPSSSRAELYFRDQRLEFYQLYKLLTIAGDRYLAEPLIEFIQANRRWSDKERYQAARAVLATRPRQMTRHRSSLFFYRPTVFGGVMRIFVPAY